MYDSLTVVAGAGAASPLWSSHDPGSFVRARDDLGFAKVAEWPAHSRMLFDKLEGCWIGNKLTGAARLVRLDAALGEPAPEMACCTTGRKPAELATQIVLEFRAHAATGLGGWVELGTVPTEAIPLGEGRSEFIQNLGAMANSSSVAPFATTVSTHPIGMIVPESGNPLEATLATIGHVPSTFQRVDSIVTMSMGILRSCSHLSFQADSHTLTLTTTEELVHQTFNTTLAPSVCLLDLSPGDACSWPECWIVPRPGGGSMPTSRKLYKNTAVLHRSSCVAGMAHLDSGSAVSRIQVVHLPRGTVTSTTTTPQMASSLASASEAVRSEPPDWTLTVALSAAGITVVLVCATCAVVAFLCRRGAASPRTGGVVAPENIGKKRGGEPGSSALSSSELFDQSRPENIMRAIKKDWLVPAKSLKVLEPVSSGGFGTVSKALMLDCFEVAIKSCRDWDMSSATFQNQVGALKNEIRLYRRIRHQNIVLFYGATLMPGNVLGLVLQWIDGGDFWYYLKYRHNSGEYREEWQQCRTSTGGVLFEQKLLADVVRGIMYLHGQEPCIIHRDLKPGNILVERTRPPKAKLTDFGLGRYLRQGEDAHAMAGTRCYMAPEVAERKPDGAAVDIFSFGCVALVSMTAEHPEEGRALEAATALRQKNMDAREELAPIVLLDAACGCLAFEPTARPALSDVYARLTSSREGVAPPTHEIQSI